MPVHMYECKRLPGALTLLLTQSPPPTSKMTARIKKSARRWDWGISFRRMRQAARRVSVA